MDRVEEETVMFVVNKAVERVEEETVVNKAVEKVEEEAVMIVVDNVLAKDLTHEVGKVLPPGADGGNKWGTLVLLKGLMMWSLQVFQVC